MGKVFFALPDHLDRGITQLHGDFDGLGDVIILQPATKATARHQDMHMDVIRIQTRQLGHIGLHEARNLRTSPDIQTRLGHFDHDAHGFQRRVGEIGNAVFRLNHIGTVKRGGHIAFVFETAVLMIVGHGCRDCVELVGGVPDIGRRPPVAVDSPGRLKRPPRVIGHNGNTAGDRQDAAHPTHRLGRFGVKADDAAADGWIGAGGGIDHAVHHHIDAIGQGAG